MRVLIAGGTGFIGRRFAELLLAEGAAHGVTSVRIGARDTAAARDLAAAGAEVVEGNLADPALARRAAQGVDAVMHCAGRSGLGGRLRLYHANIDITRALLEAAGEAGASRFVHIGSPSMYFDRTNTLGRDEDYTPARLPDGYTRSKAIADRMVLEANRPGFATLSLRPRFATGRGDRYLLSRFIAMHARGMLRRIGSGENLVDFTAAANLADAMLLALKAPEEACGRAYNITNGEPVRLWEFLDETVQRVGMPPIRRRVDYRAAAAVGMVVEGAFVFANRAPGLSRLSAAVLSHSMTMSIERARSVLGYAPRQTNAAMLDEFVDWYRAEGRS